MGQLPRRHLEPILTCEPKPVSNVPFSLHGCVRLHHDNPARLPTFDTAYDTQHRLMTNARQYSAAVRFLLFQHGDGCINGVLSGNADDCGPSATHGTSFRHLALQRIDLLSSLHPLTHVSCCHFVNRRSLSVPHRHSLICHL